MPEQVWTTIVISGEAPWVPVAIASTTHPEAASVAAVIANALGRVGMSDAVLCAVRSLASMADAAVYLQLAADTLDSMVFDSLGAGVEIGIVLIARVKHDVGTQSAVDMVDVSTADAVVAEAQLIGEQMAAKEAAARYAVESMLKVEAAVADTAEQCVSQLIRDSQITDGLLRHAHRSADWRTAERCDAEKLAACERAMRQVLEQLLKAEAADADAAEARAAAAEARAAAAEARATAAEARATAAESTTQAQGWRGGRGGRGRRGVPPTPPAPPPPPPPPPPPDMISAVLAVELEQEGRMTSDEALAILNVTHKRPIWLLSEVHPDKHPERREEAAAATARVVLAREVRGGRVSKVSYED
jgi:hypothetical protein